MSTILQVPSVTLRQDDQGVFRVGDSRVRLDSVITAWKLGDSPEQIAENFDSLNLADIYGAISYYLGNRTKVDDYLAKNRQAGEQLRSEIEARFPSSGVRERLLARQQAKRVKGN